MNNTSLNIVAFDVPYPPNYGGIIDVFYKLKSLHQLGVKINFHCFFYHHHNPKTKELEKYCHQVFYYQRKKHIGKLLLSKTPYIVASRNNKQLLTNLLNNQYPILFEGLHSCFYLNHPQLKHRKKIVRAHNIEHFYYKELAKVEPNQFKKIYLNWEAKKLAKFEINLSKCNAILSIAKKDVNHFKRYAKTYYIPPFYNQLNLPFSHQLFADDNKYLLYQGNLSVTENIKAVEFIIDKIAPQIEHLIVIAGKNPPQFLQSKIKNIKNVKLISNPGESKMLSLLQNAHINLLFTFQQTGVKLKLIHALEVGKHIIINQQMEDDNTFSKMCVIANQPQDIIKQINQLITVDFTNKDKAKRHQIFKTYFDNPTNAKLVLDIINS